MKNSLIVALIFIFSLMCGNISYSNSAAVPAHSQKATSTKTINEFIYIRVLINGLWWTYIYNLDGSFVVAIPDDEE